QVLSNVYWHFSFASNTGGDSTCFYVATWKISNNTLIANHGSAASPIGCQSSTVAQYDVALPEITNTDQVKDFLGLRVYGKNAGNYIKTDGNWLSGSLMYNNGTQSYANFTVLNSDRYSVEPGNPSPPSQASWGLAKYNDGTSGSSYVVSTGGNLPASATSSFDTTKYLEFDQPSAPWIDPVPTGATITASSITISYNAATGSGANMCLEALVYVSGSLVPKLQHRVKDANKLTASLRRTQDKVADFITAFAGSLQFVYLHSIWFGIWILLNVGLIGAAVEFDRFPFGLLTMIVSLEAI